jgi:6-phosphogluconolactonase
VTGRDVEIEVAEDEDAAARRVAELLAEAAAAGRQIALTGGSTPRKAYVQAAALEPDWSRAGVWWGDERSVPPTDDRSNFRLAEETLLSRLERPPAAVHRIRGELAPERAAGEYDDELRGVQLDLVLLGLGPDGHVASLFPNQPALEELERRAIANEPRLDPYVQRVTLTLPVLRSAPDVVFLVAGEQKADAVTRAFAGAPSAETPGSLVRSESGRTLAVLDRAAAAHLPR